jgi:hypothetical protein
MSKFKMHFIIQFFFLIVIFVTGNSCGVRGELKPAFKTIPQKSDLETPQSPYFYPRSDEDRSNLESNDLRNPSPSPTPRPGEVR